MEYKDEIFNRKTGEFEIISKGDWITVSELGALYDVGPRKVREILRHMGFLHVEGARIHQRHRLARWVTDRDWGKRLSRTTGKAQIPFDVIGPEAREWIAERWDQTREQIDAQQSCLAKEASAHLERFRDHRNQDRNALGKPEMTVREMVFWLKDHHPSLTQAEISTILFVSQPLVSRLMSERKGTGYRRWTSKPDASASATPQ